MAYSVRNQGETGINLPLVCLQCKEPVGPPPYLSREVRDEHGAVMGYLHPIGDCKEKWEKAHPPSGGAA
jgi:hypothetical protein